LEVDIAEKNVTDLNSLLSLEEKANEALNELAEAEAEIFEMSVGPEKENAIVALFLTKDRVEV